MFCSKRSCLLFKKLFIYLWGFPCGSEGKESACNAGDLGSIPGLGRSPGEGEGYQLQYSGLENSMDCIVPGVAKSRTRLNNFHFHLFIFGCTGSLLLCAGFLYWGRWGLLSICNAQASRCSGFSCC